MEGKYNVHLETKTYQTKYRQHFINITKDLNEVIKNSGIKRGLVVVQTHHTTCGVWVNEDEKNLIGPSEEIGYTSDLRKVLDNFADPMHEYGHNDIRQAGNESGKRFTHLCEPDENGIINECVNGHAHAQALIVRPSISLIIEEGKWHKGRWQELLLVELDHDRPRQVSFLVSGVK